MVRKNILRKIVFTVLTVSTIAFPMATSRVQAEPKVTINATETNSIVGTWNIRQTLSDGSEVLLIYQFSSDGNFLGAGSVNGPAFRTPLVGIWTKTGPGKYTAKLKSFLYSLKPNENGDLVNTLTSKSEATATFTLTKDGKELTGTISVNNYDLNGNFLSTVTFVSLDGQKYTF